MISPDRFAAAVRASWTEATSADPGEWHEGNPSRGQCDVTSLVVLEYFGGDLQLAQVSLDGDQVEHHYWNQLDDDKMLDLTRDQFRDGQRLSQPETVSHELIRSKYPEARTELRRRHQALRDSVTSHLGLAPGDPLG